MLGLLAQSCGGAGTPTSPSVQPLPVAAETLSFRYHYSAGDTVDTKWQESYHAWAIARLAVQMPQKIDYFRYRSRQDMGDHTGRYNTNGFADPATFEQPHQYATGIEYVIVNGKPVLEHGTHTGARPGAIVYGQGRK